MPETKKEKTSQNILLENREKLEMSGVKDVNSFNDQQIIATTSLGFLIIKGSNLHVKKFNVSTKELNVTGKIDELKYKDSNNEENKSFLKRLFK